MTNSQHVVAVLATLDTKGAEANYLRQRIERHGMRALVIDMGVVGEPQTTADVTHEQVADLGGKSLAELLANPSRQAATPVMVRGATRVLLEAIERGDVHAVLGMGGTQGTPNCTQVMQALPYGFPKVMVSTIASGDTSQLVDIKDITMMFSVSDILGLNALTRKVLANAAAAACGIAALEVELEAAQGDKPTIGMTNLGVLTEGAIHALELFRAKGYEAIVFHAVGSGGRAMEQLMKDGVIGAVFDYALGEISDEVFSGLRAGGPERLTVAGSLGLPQVLCPGGAEHIGLLVQPNTLPERYASHQHVFHNPIIAAPRLKAEELETVADEIGRRLQTTRGRASFFFPQRGTSRYAIEGGELRDPDGDRAFFARLDERLPATIERRFVDAGAEDPAFVEAAVARLIELIEAPQ